MMILVIGGSGSGKSEFAEELTIKLSEGNLCGGNRGKGDCVNAMRKYYIATMQVMDEEGREKVARHRRLRDGKGFVTIEQPVSVWEAVKGMEEGDRAGLLECVSNLAANEMFGENIARKGNEERVRRMRGVVEGIGRLKMGLTHLVVVSNNIFEDGRNYDEGTMAYIRAMGKINEKLAAMADEVIEVVAGIPVRVKGTGTSWAF